MGDQKIKKTKSIEKQIKKEMIKKINRVLIPVNSKHDAVHPMFK